MIAGKGSLAGTLLLVLSATAAAQVPFSLLVTQPGVSAITIQNGGAVTMGAAVGSTQTAQILITYTGTGQVTIPQQPSIVGSSVFTATLSGKPPLSLSPGSGATLNVTFSPTNGSQDTAQLSLSYVETLSATQANGGTISIALQGIAPTFSLYYILQTNLNAVALAPGGQIPFPATVAGATSQASLNVTNTGSGAGTVTGITITPGSGFSLQGTPPFPYSVAANGGNLQVLVLYTPTAVGSNSGQVTISFGSGPPVTVNLAGTGISPSFTYQLLNTTPPTVSPGGTISFPGTNVGGSSSITVHVLNSGTASGTVNSIALAGQGYQFATPPVVPQTLAPNGSLTFTINFAPTTPGSFPGTLLVNSDTFTLSGTGLGPLLVFSYLANGTSITLSTTNSSVVFSPVMITQSEQLIFDVKNTGTLPATISNIGVTPVSGPYSVAGTPPLPVTLAPNGDFELEITFTPTALGYSNGTLMLDATSVALVGSGTQPPPLPPYTITGPSGTTAPFAQPTIGLSLANAYPVAISGSLTISATGMLPADPAVQFASGGTTVSFTIPANQTAAMFGTQGTQLGLQTGTVAETVTLTPSFATQAGNVPLTPATPSTLQFTVAPAAPQIIAVQLTALSANGFTVQATGFATTRTLTSSTIQIAPAKGFSMPNSQFTFDLSQASALWFQSTASNAYGGEFTVSIPFTFQGLAANQSIVNAVSAVSVTVNNELGASTSMQATP